MRYHAEFWRNKRRKPYIQFYIYVMRSMNPTCDVVIRRTLLHRTSPGNTSEVSGYPTASVYNLLVPVLGSTAHCMAGKIQTNEVSSPSRLPPKYMHVSQVMRLQANAFPFLQTQERCTPIRLVAEVLTCDNQLSVG